MRLGRDDGGFIGLIQALGQTEWDGDDVEEGALWEL